MKTDKQLQQDVVAELQWEPSVDAAHIGVEVRDGVVTLAGHVDSYAEKWGAENAAQRVGGVRAMAIELHVKLPGASERTDADTASNATSALEWLTTVPQGAVKVMVEGGRVTLTGEVEFAYQRWSAETAIRCLFGVTDVVNRVALKQGVAPAAARSGIEPAAGVVGVVDRMTPPA
jgi:osmotically-inducible protein OsmY